MKVSKGLGTYAGLVAAFAQYLGAVALFLEADDPVTGLGPLATATATLMTVLVGRFGQARDAIKNQPASAPAVFSTPMTSTAASAISGQTGANVVYTTPTGTTFQSSRPGVEGEFVREPKSPPAHELRDLHENGET